ncbi:MAG: head decoration protein [Myxococcales bacterium]
MAVVTRTTIDNGSVIAPGYKQQTQQEPVTFGGAGTLLQGTILARDSSTLKLVPFVKGGVTNGNGIPKAVLLYPVTATGAGDVQADALVSGGVRLERLVINADGNAANIDGAVRDQLRAFDIVPVTTQQLSVLDP